MLKNEGYSFLMRFKTNANGELGARAHNLASRIDDDAEAGRTGEPACPGRT
jgi:hypothetical protein